ncbi:MAG: tRNA (5-methylaminomethyl-2-thiouridine)(34)-methyltransferase MnmD [Balneolaceae bacterium]
MCKKVHTTADGSSTIFNAEINQYYHNPNGAVTESLHVFFETSGLLNYLKSAKSLTILEVGFGTGLNFLLLLGICIKRNLNIPIRFFSIEASPLDTETAHQLNFADHLENPSLKELLPEFFSGLKSGINLIKPLDGLDAELHLFVGDFEAFDSKNLKADFIFHDPFSPEVNEELWTAEVFQKLAGFSRPSVVVTTYSAASKARGAMASAGWFVARAPGALGKREMTIASLEEAKLENFKRVNEQNLASRYKEGDFS